MREAVSLMNEEHHILLYGLVALAATPPDVATFRRRVQTLIEDTRAHFHNEEGAMRAFAYPDYERHRAEHDRLLREAETRLAALSPLGTVNACAEISDFLRKWLIQHMERDDAQFAAFLACWEGAARA